MKIFNRLLSLILVIAVLAGILVLPASAEDVQPAEGTGYAENPLYDYHTDFEETLLCTGSNQSAAAEHTDAAFVTAAEAAEQLRDHMAARDTVFTIYIAADSVDFNAVRSDACSEEYANSPETGDYLAWSWSKIYWEYTRVSDGRWKYNVKAAYYDTAEQEQNFVAQLKQVVEELNVWEESDYLKYQTIYNYILEHVTYDREGLETHSDDYWGYDAEYKTNTYIDALGNNDNLIYTAYDGLCCGKAVCQGYSCLLYAMCRSCGLNVRIQDGGNHSWNIVELDGLWYYMDATWDALRGSGSQVYFLKGTEDFAGHSPKAAYETEEYLAAHPMAETAYQPQESDYEKVLPFRDVSKTAYYYTPVSKTYEMGIFTGVNHYLFMPNNQMTRGMVVAVLYRLAGKPDCGTDSGFVDVSPTKYYAPAIAWAVKNDIARGMTSTTFAPNEAVTRQQFATFVYRYAQAMGYDVSACESLSTFADAGDVSSYAVSAMQWAVGAKLINGINSTTLSPKGTATRGQVATILYRFIQYYGLEPEHDQTASQAA